MPSARLSSDNSAFVLMDYAVGFANLFRSHRVEENVNAATALAKAALAFDIPLVVTHSEDTDPPGPIYPSVLEALGDHEIVRRGGSFDAFDSPSFEAAVEATGRRTLALAGLMTEGCVLQTALGALRRSYEVLVVVDACAGETKEAHDAALQRLTKEGATLTTWLSLVTEYQRSWENVDTVGAYINLLVEHSPQLGMNFLAQQAAGASARA
jgi:nicotinamidase-related amidase